jgi:MFS family permease
MLAAFIRLLGGRAAQQRELRSLFLAVLLTDLGVSAAFPLRMLYAQAHHATPLQLGLIAGVFFLSPLIVQVPLGWLVDRWGRVPLLLLGTASHAAIGFAYIVFNTPVDLIVLRFLEGISVAAITPAMYAYIADVTPPEHRSEAYGVLGSVSMGGLLIGPLIGGTIGQVFGFAAAYFLSAAIEVGAVGVVITFIREPARHVHEERTTGTILWQQLMTLPLLGAYAAFFTFQIVMGMFSALWTIWMRDLGGSYTYIGITFTVFALPQIFLGAVAGRASAKWGRARVLVISGVLTSLIYIEYGYLTNLALLLVLGVAEGIFLAYQQPAVQSLLADASPVSARGRTQGIAGVAGALGGAGSAFVALPMYHQSHSMPFLLSGLIMGAGSIAAAASAALLTQQERHAMPKMIDE